MVSTFPRVSGDAAPRAPAATRLLQPSALPRLPDLTADDDAFMVALANDTNDVEESPWLMMGDLQFWSTSRFAHALAAYAASTGRDWYVASMLEVSFPWPLPPHLRAFEDGEDEIPIKQRRKKLAPDTMVAPHASKHARTSFNMIKEGGFPPFVLEVVSPSSRTRDEADKKRAYDLLGVAEYIIFTPRAGKPSTLVGWRRGESKRFEPWAADAQGRLWSTVLELYVLTQGENVRAQTVEGILLPTLEEEADGRRRAEDEVARLRVEIEILRHGDKA